MRLLTRMAMVVAAATLGVSVMAQATTAPPAGGQDPSLAATKSLIKHVFKASQKYKMKIDVQMQPEKVSAEATNIDVNIETEDTVQKVNEDGSAKIESKYTAMKVTLNGNVVMDEPPTDTEKSTVSANNTPIDFESANADDGDFGKRLTLAMAPIYSDKALGVGDAWTHEFKEDKAKGWRAGTATHKLVAFETVNGVKCAKIEHAYIEKPYADDQGSIKVNSTYWIDLATGMLVKGEGKGTGFFIPNVPVEGTLKMTFKIQQLK